MAVTSHLFLLCLVALVTSSYAQVYLSTSGSVWNGACDNSCPVGTPCSISTGTTTISSACTINYVAGTGYGAHAFSGAGTGQIIIRSTGTIEFGGIVSYSFASAAVRLASIEITTGSDFTITAASVEMANIEFEATGTNQITVVDASPLAVSNSQFTGSNYAISYDAPPNAEVTMDEVAVQSSMGPIRIISDVGSEPDVTITNSVLVPFQLITNRMATVLLSNVNGSIPTTGSIFTVAPTNLIIEDCNVVAGATSYLSTLSSASATLEIRRSTFDNVMLRSQQTTSTVYSDVKVVAPDASKYLIDASSGYGTSMVLRNIQLETTSGTGSSSLMTFQVNGQHSWELNNLDISTSSSNPVMRLTSGTLNFGATPATLPSLYFASGTNFIFTGDNIDFMGDLSSATAGTTGFVTSTSNVDIHSITFSSNTVLDLFSVVTVTYHVTKPTQGIVCTGSSFDCLPTITTKSLSIGITWDASLPLPDIGTSYPLINYIPSEPGYRPNPEFDIVHAYDTGTHAASFSFNEVTCAANCVAANSGPCVSRYVCTCKPGFEGTNCECPTGGCPPTPQPVPEAPVPVSTPSFTPITPSPVPESPAPEPVPSSGPSPSPGPSPVPSPDPSPSPMPPTSSPETSVPTPISVPEASGPIPSAPIGSPVPLSTPAPTSSPETVVPTPINTPDAATPSPMSTPETGAPSAVPPPPSPVGSPSSSSSPSSSPIADSPSDSPSEPSSSPPPSPVGTPSGNTPTSNDPPSAASSTSPSAALALAIFIFMAAISIY